MDTGAFDEVFHVPNQIISRCEVLVRVFCKAQGLVVADQRVPIVPHVELIGSFATLSSEALVDANEGAVARIVLEERAGARALLEYPEVGVALVHVVR